MTDYLGLFDPAAVEDDPAAKNDPSSTLFSSEQQSVHPLYEDKQQISGNDAITAPYYNNPYQTQQDDNADADAAAANNDDDDARRTIFMTSLFLVLMVLYVGFCFYYRKGKMRRSVGDYDSTGENGESARRQRRRRENQSVLDESNNAASRARENAEEQAKMEERKGNIKQALLLRLIVDDDEEEDQPDAEKVVVECSNAKDCECENCQYWRWDSKDNNGNSDGNNSVASKNVEKSTEEKGGNNEAVLNVDASPSIKRGIITIQEEESDADHEDELEENVGGQVKLSGEAVAKAQDDLGHDIEAQALSNETSYENNSASMADQDGNIEAQNSGSHRAKANNSTTTSTSPTASPSSPCMLNPPLPPSSRLSLSSPKKYTDALLNCGSHSRINCLASNTITNCGGSIHNASANSCGGLGNKACGSIHGKLGFNRSNHGAAGGDAQTIALSTILSLYGEECNICLSSFQVGDRAAWSKLHDGGDENAESSDLTADDDENDTAISDDNNNENEANNESAESETKSDEETSGCIHVFHEECISRWLLVRDGCPICRRSYFPKGTGGNGNDTADASSATTTTVATASISSASANTADATSRGDEVDVELGMNNRSRSSNQSQVSRVADLTGRWW